MPNAEGWTKTAILDQLELTQKTLRAAGRERDEDAVMDVLDFLTGWCSPHMQLRLEKSAVAPDVSASTSANSGRVTSLEETQQLE